MFRNPKLDEYDNNDEKDIDESDDETVIIGWRGLESFDNRDNFRGVCKLGYWYHDFRVMHC